MFKEVLITLYIYIYKTEKPFKTKGLRSLRLHYKG